MELKSLEKLGNRLVAEVGRLADANEAIVKLAGEQQEMMEAPQPGPPFCPHCGQFNPVVTRVHTGDTGELGSYVLAAKCESCKEVMFAIPDGWTMMSDMESALEYLGERKGGQ